MVIYGPKSHPSIVDNEVYRNRESGIFTFAGARPYLSKNVCYDNHHFGIAVRDSETLPDIVRNICHHNMLSGILLFHQAKALVLENRCHDNMEWGMVITPDCIPTPGAEKLTEANDLGSNPQGALRMTEDPLSEIGR